MPVSRARGVPTRHRSSELKQGKVRLPSRELDVRCCLSMWVEWSWSSPSVLDSKTWPAVLEHGYGEQGIHTGTSYVGYVQKN